MIRNDQHNNTRVLLSTSGHFERNSLEDNIIIGTKGQIKKNANTIHV
jgi:hypothetical protein